MPLPRLFPIAFLAACGIAGAHPIFKDSKLESYLQAAHDPAASVRPDRICLSWSGDPATSFSVTWRTSDQVAKAYAQVAPATPSVDFIRKVSAVTAKSEDLDTEHGKVRYHEATLAGLKPESLYLYRVGSDSGWSEWIQVRTASQEAKPFRFIYFGDAQNHVLAHWSRVLRQAYRNAPEAAFLLHAGDLINRAHRNIEWGEWFAAGDWLQASIPQVAVPGNHEYDPMDREDPKDNRELLSRFWRPQFAFPQNGPKGLEETVFWLDHQGTRIIGLNSVERIAEQKPWLEKVLAKNPNRWTIVTFHHPVFSTARGRDNKEVREHWKPVLEKAAVDLVLQGHDHTYGRGAGKNLPEGKSARDAKSGTLYVVSVSGPKMYGLDSDWWTRGAENTQLYQVIDVARDTLRYEARTATGELYDAFDLVKQKKGPNRLIDRAPKTPMRRFAPEDSAKAR